MQQRINIWTPPLRVWPADTTVPPYWMLIPHSTPHTPHHTHTLSLSYYYLVQKLICSLKVRKVKKENMPNFLVKRIFQRIKHNYSPRISDLPHTASIHYYTCKRVFECGTFMEGALHSFHCTVVYFTTMSVYQDPISSSVGSLGNDEQMEGFNKGLFRSTILALSWRIWVKPQTCQGIQCSGRFWGQTPPELLSRS